MATPKVLIKRSSVAGRIPTTGDLDYGELAINFQDGKIYYKDASNNIKAFVDSARVQAIADAVEVTAQAQLDSAEVTSLIDAAYIQARQNNFLDSALAIQLIDSAYVQLRQTLVGEAGIDSAGAVTIINSTVDQSFVRNLETPNPTLGNDFVDSDQVLTLVDQTYVRNRETPNPTLGNDFVDSSEVTTLIDSTYVQNRQIKYTTADFVDSAGVSAIILSNVTTSYVRDRQIKYTTADFPDSAGVSSIFATKTTTDLTEGTNLYYTKARTDSDIAASLTDSSNSVYINTTTIITDQVDSAYVLARVNEAPFLDSYYTTALIDSTYVQLRQDKAYSSLTGAPTIPTFGNDFVDSATVIRLISNEALDSDLTIALVDSAYIQLRDRFQDSSLVTSTVDQTYVRNLETPNPTLGNDFVDSAQVQAIVDQTYVRNLETPNPTLGNDFVDSGQVTAIVDSAYIETRRPAEAVFKVVNNGASAYSFTGDGFSSSVDNPTIYLQRGLTYKFSVNASGHPFQIRVSNGGSAYNTGVTNNGAQTGVVTFTPDMTAPNTLVYQCTVHGGMVGNIVIVDNNSFLDSSTVTGVISAAYIQSNQIKYNTSNFTDSATVIRLITENAIDSSVALQLLLDSSEVVNLIDSAYIQLRQSGGEITIQDEGTPLSTAATTLNFVGSAVTATGSGTTKTITITQAVGGTDSATVVTIIGETVDSAYVQLRQSSVGAGGLDSALVTQLVDSAYVTARQSGTVNITDAITQTVFYYTADSGQTTFTGADDDGGTLAYTTNKIAVYINGLYQQETVDYTATNGTSVVLTEAADSGDIIAIETLQGSNLTSQPIFRKVYHYTATNGQTAFTGADDFSDTLTYKVGRVQAYLNGIMLISTTDFTATDGSTVTLTVGADSGDIVSIEKLDGTGMGIDSAVANTLIDARVTQSFVNNLNVDAETLGGRDSSYLLNYNNFTNTPTIPTLGNDFVDSAEVVTLITANAIDSAAVIALIDSAYVQAREGAGGGGTVDSATTIAIVEDELAVFSVGDLVGADGNPGDALISDGDGTASWNGNVALSYEFKVNYDSLGVISSVSDLPTGFTADSTGSNSIIISHNTGRSVKDISYNSYVSGTLKLRHPSRDSADVVTYAVADRLNKFTATVGIANTGADADQYAWVNITF